MPMSEQMRGLISEAVHQVFMYITDNIDTFAEEYALTDEDINNLRHAQQLMVVVKDAAAQSVEQVLEQTGAMAPVDQAAYAEPETNGVYEQMEYSNVAGSVVEEAEAVYETAQDIEAGSDDVNASAYMHIAEAPVQEMMAGEAVADAEEIVTMGIAEVGVVEETEEDEESYEDDFVDEDEYDEDEDDEDEDDEDDDEDDEDDDDEDDDEDEDDEDDDDDDEDEDDDVEDDYDDEDDEELMQPTALTNQVPPVSVGELVNPYDANRAQLLDMLQRSLVDYEFARRLRQFFGIA